MNLQSIEKAVASIPGSSTIWWDRIVLILVMMMLYYRA
jgi:hypothetical protein